MKRNYKWSIILVCFVLILGSLTACNSTPQDKKVTAESKGMDKPFQGKKLTVYFANIPWGETIKKLVPEFESQTGMKVEVQSFAEDQLSQRLSVQLTSKANTPDIFMTRPVVEAKLYESNGWYQALDDFVKQDPAYDFNDFSKSAMASTTVKNKLTSIPIISDQQILYYRKDLLQKAGLSVPKTLDELEEAIKKIHDPQKSIYGFVARGQRNLLVTAVSSFLFSEGGDFMTGGKASLNTPESIKGFKRYGEWLKNYGPPGVMNMSWQQAMGIFAQGKAAFYTDSVSIYKNAIDKDKSLIADNVGYALFPAGKAGSKPYNITPWGIAMNPNVSSKEAAWEFMKWATNKETTLKTQSDGSPSARISIWDNPDASKGFPAELLPIIKEESKIGVGHALPDVTNVGEARDIIGEIVVKVMSGEDVNAAADKANQGLQNLIDKEKSK